MKIYVAHSRDFDYQNELYVPLKNSDLFEQKTPGAFLLCTKLDSLNLVSKEIVRQTKKDKRIVFNIITTGSKCDKVMSFLNDEKNKEFKDCIKNLCIYCMNLKKWAHLKEKYPIVHSVCNNQLQVLEFINEKASTEIKTFHVTKLITLNDYLSKYKDRHFEISKFYGNLTAKTYKEYLENFIDVPKLLRKNWHEVCYIYDNYNIHEIYY